MFVTRSTLNWLLKERDCEIKALQDRYWGLWHKHNMLLTHLGLSEVEVPSRIEIVETKKPPEGG